MDNLVDLILTVIVALIGLVVTGFVGYGIRWSADKFEARWGRGNEYGRGKIIYTLLFGLVLTTGWVYALAGLTYYMPRIGALYGFMADPVQFQRQPLDSWGWLIWGFVMYGLGMAIYNEKLKNEFDG